MLILLFIIKKKKKVCGYTFYNVYIMCPSVHCILICNFRLIILTPCDKCTIVRVRNRKHLNSDRKLFYIVCNILFYCATYLC